MISFVLSFCHAQASASTHQTRMHVRRPRRMHEECILNGFLLGSLLMMQAFVQQHECMGVLRWRLVYLLCRLLFCQIFFLLLSYDCIDWLVLVIFSKNPRNQFTPFIQVISSLMSQSRNNVSTVLLSTTFLQW